MARPVLESVATYKLGAAMAGSILSYAFWLTAAGVLGGRQWVVAAAVLLPVLGVIAVRATARMRRFMEDAHLFLTLCRRPDLPERLAAERAAIARELDAIRELLPSPSPPPAGRRRGA